MKSSDILKIVLIFVVIGLIVLVLDSKDSDNNKLEDFFNKNYESEIETDPSKNENKNEDVFNQEIIEKDGKINVYLFWGDGCPHCENAKNFFNELAIEYGDYYKFITYEVWNNTYNNDLLYDVASELGVNVRGVPFILIGEQYFSGYSSSSNEKIKNAIIEEYNNDNYIDIVEKVK